MIILIPTKLDKVAREILEENHYTVVQDEKTPLDELISQYNEVEGMIVRSEKITAEIIDALPRLKLIVRAGSGVNTIDIHYAREKNISVMNTPGANANAVAEEVIAMVLAVKRHIISADCSARQGLWEKSKFMGQELTGKNVGIVGFGHIGQLLAKRLKGFETNIMIFDPIISKSKLDNAQLVSLEELFSQADIISLHVPLNSKTKKMINKSLLSLMKEGAILINCARYEIIDEADLREVKKTKKITYCNDVYPKDEAGEKSIKDLADIMLPHLGASTKEANSNAARKAAEQMVGFFTEGITTFTVNQFIPEGLSPIYQELASKIARLALAYHGTCLSTYKIECSFYGELNQYKQFLIPPILKGLSNDFPTGNCNETVIKDYLKNKGINLKVRKPDKAKNYGESITIDLIQGEDIMYKASVRGTVVENRLVISRINQFDKLYFDSVGINIIFIYQDRPGVLAEITQYLSSEHINIEDIRSPHSPPTAQSMAIVKINQSISDELLEKIKIKINAEKAFLIKL